MEVKKIKELVDMMKANDLSELEIVDGQTRIVLKRGPGQTAAPVIAMTSALPVNGANSVAPEVPAAPPPAETISTAETAAQEDLTEIISPLVGTLYTAPSPNADPFIEVGSVVDEETIVCIIEAMKVMNEIKSGVKGIIKKILIENGSAVEYGQPLFLVEPE